MERESVIIGLEGVDFLDTSKFHHKSADGFPSSDLDEGISTISRSLPSPTDEARPEPSSPGAANMIKSPDRRSPSCTRGKTMRDFEEELSNLKRENFDLKMRIYVLNEHLELVQSFDNIEEIYETHTKLKNEIQSLRTELEDKEDLILKTGDAMNLLTNKHREEIANLKAKALDEAQKYEDFILRLKQEMASSHRNVMEDSTAVYAMAFGLQDQESEGTNSDFELKNQLTKLENELAKRDQSIECADGEIRCLKQRIEELQHEMKKVENELESKTAKLDEVFTDLRAREVKIDELHKQVFSLETLVKEKHAEVEDLSSKLESINGFEVTHESCSKDKKFLKEENELLREQLTQVHATVNRKLSRDYLDSTISKPVKQCSSCLKRSNLEADLEKLKKLMEEKEAELEEKKAENRKTYKALQGFVKANKSLTKDVENLRVQLETKSEQLENLKSEMEAKGETLDPENIENRTETERDIRPEGKKMDEDKVKVLENKIKDLMEVLDAKEKAMKGLKEARGDDEERVEELQVVVSTLKSQLDAILTKENDEMKALKVEIEAKNKSIDQLNEELRKRTFNLQELVNTELWDKNREIEKLNKICEKKQQESSELRAKMESQQNELISLNDKIEELSDNISSKMTKSDFSRLTEQFENERETNKKLKARCEDLEKEVKRSEKARKELINACVLLQTRLEELVSFMDSLMPYAGKNKKMYQEAVDKSREVSRALSMSVLEESLQPILPDFSQVDFFHDSFREKSNEFVLDDVTEGSVPDLPSDITELKKLTPKVESESEEWSEPDRNVSKERIGITETVAKIKPESSDVSEHSDKNPSKRRHKSNEVRKLNLKLKQLGDVVETLRLSPSKCHPDLAMSLNDQNSSAVVDKVMEGRKQIDETLRQTEAILKQISSLSIDEAGKTALENQITFISDQLAGMTILCQEFECFLIQTESERKSLCLKIFEADRKFESLNTLVLRQQSEIKEKENEVLEKQCALLDLQNKFLINDAKNKNVENRLADANGKLQEYLKNSELEKQICYEKHAQEVAKIQHKLKQKQEEHSKEINQFKALLEKANESIEELNLARINSEDEHKQQLDLIIKETKTKIEEETSKRIEAERKLVASYEIQADLRNQLENEITNTRTISSTQRKMESWWRKKLHESEAVYLERESDLRRRLDAATLSTSQAVLERTRLANDKIKLQCELRRRDDFAHEVKAALEQRVSELEEANNELEKKLSCLGMPRSEPGSPNHNYNRQRSNPTSDYTSDPDHGSTNNIWFSCGRNNNCSPDLGIESDQGRLSSLDAVSSPKEGVEEMKSEIEGLREELARTKKALTKSLNLLEDSKQKKKQIEKAISQQIGMTNKILSKARLNLGAPES